MAFNVVANTSTGFGITLGPPIVEFLQNSIDTTINTLTKTFSAQNVGTADIGRYVILAVETFSTANAPATFSITSVTVGGVEAIEITQIYKFTASTSNATSGIFICYLPTGTAADVVVSTSTSSVRTMIQMYRAVGIDPTPVDFGAVIAATDLTDTIDVVSGGFAIANGLNNAGTTITFTGVNEDVDTTSGGSPSSTYGSGHQIYTANETGRTMTIDFLAGTSTASAGTFASWGPGSNLPPAVVLDSPADANSTTDTTPSLLFTGTDPDASDIQYNFYARRRPLDELTAVGNFGITGSTGGQRRAQSFVPDSSGIITNAYVELVKNGTPTDNVRCFIYSDSSGEPGSELDQSETLIDMSTIPTTATSYNFSFASGPTLIQGVTYWLVFDRSGAPDDANYFTIRGSTTDAGGQVCKIYNGTVWGATGLLAMKFVVSDAVETIIDVDSNVDPGFVNLDNGGDTDPFTSGDQISYTFQSAVPYGLYDWKVRGIDPADTNFFGTWSSTNSLRIIGSNFSYEAAVSLPVDDGLLSNLYSPSDITDVATDDNTYKAQVGSGFIIEQRWLLNANNTDQINASWTGKSSRAPISNPVHLQLYEIPTTATYYFDGNIATSDPDSNFTNDTNAWDGDGTTSASRTSLGTVSTNYLEGKGTTAPGSGGTVTGVRARVYGDTLTTTGYATVTAPIGGWNWDKVQKLEARTWMANASGNISAAIFEEGDAGGTQLYSASQSFFSSGAYKIELEVTTGGWITLDSNSVASADTEFTLSGTQTTLLSSYYGTNNRISVRVYQGIA